MDALNYVFEYKEHILYKYYRGLISVEYIKQSWLEAMGENFIPPDVQGFVLDYRSAHFNFNPNRHYEITDFYKEHLDVFGKKRIAFVTNNSNDIVIPILIQTLDNGYESRPFSSMEAAIQWVQFGVPVAKS